MSDTVNWLQTFQVRCDVDKNLWSDQHDRQDVHDDENWRVVLNWDQIIQNQAHDSPTRKMQGVGYRDQ